MITECNVECCDVKAERTGTSTKLYKLWESLARRVNCILKEKLATSSGVGVWIWEMILYKEAAGSEGPWLRRVWGISIRETQIIEQDWRPEGGQITEPPTPAKV